MAKIIRSYIVWGDENKIVTSCNKVRGVILSWTGETIIALDNRRGELRFPKISSDSSELEKMISYCHLVETTNSQNEKVFINPNIIEDLIPCEDHKVRVELRKGQDIGWECLSTYTGERTLIREIDEWKNSLKSRVERRFELMDVTEIKVIAPDQDDAPLDPITLNKTTFYCREIKTLRACGESNVTIVLNTKPYQEYEVYIGTSDSVLRAIAGECYLIRVRDAKGVRGLVAPESISQVLVGGRVGESMKVYLKNDSLFKTEIMIDDSKSRTNPLEDINWFEEERRKGVYGRYLQVRTERRVRLEAEERNGENG